MDVFASKNRKTALKIIIEEAPELLSSQKDQDYSATSKKDIDVALAKEFVRQLQSVEEEKLHSFLR